MLIIDAYVANNLPIQRRSNEKPHKTRYNLAYQNIESVASIDTPKAWRPLLTIHPWISWALKEGFFAFTFVLYISCA